MKKELNLDIPQAISEFESLIKEFFPKDIIYKLIRSRGLEFESYKEFTSQDDALSIDWKASARANKLLSRQYIEERNLDVFFVIDVGDNMVFGSAEKLKCEYCAELSAALAHLILNSGDNVGLILFNNKVIKEIVPKSGLNQFNLFVHDLSNASHYGDGSNLDIALTRIIENYNKPDSSVILISDFLSMNRKNQEKLEICSSKFETLAIMIKDPLDDNLPNLNKEIIINDPKTGQRLLINPKIAKKEYKINAQKHEKLVREIFENCNIDFLKLLTNEKFSLNLVEFLRKRSGMGAARIKNVY